LDVFVVIVVQIVDAVDGLLIIDVIVGILLKNILVLLQLFLVTTDVEMLSQMQCIYKPQRFLEPPMTLITIIIIIIIIIIISGIVIIGHKIM